MSLFETLLRPALFSIDPETAHGLSIAALKAGIVPPCTAPSDPRLKVTIAGLDLPNPVGLAAGYDKNAEVPDAILARGFGFTEVGTVTPRPQAGNPRPRLFRLARQHGVINRLGFNNEGHAKALARLEARQAGTGIVGVNIGANKDSQDFAADYVTGLETFYGVARYFTANISSPNTPGLRNLQAGDALAALLTRLFEKRERLVATTGTYRPIFLKIAPDLDSRQMDEIAGAIEGMTSASGLDGLIVSNTTISREGVETAPHAQEIGGLSGRPLFERSTIVLARMRERVGELPIIGVGGVEDAATAIAKFEAGANAVQLYTAMIYGGPNLAAKINRGLVDALDRHRLPGIAGLTGTKTREWAQRKLPNEE